MRSRERMADQHAVTRRPSAAAAEDRLMAALRCAAALGLITPPPGRSGAHRLGRGQQSRAADSVIEPGGGPAEISSLARRRDPLGEGCPADRDTP